MGFWSTRPLPFFGLIIFFPVQARASAAFSELDGDVQQRAGQDAAWERPVKGALLADGTELKTGPAGRGELVLDDGSLIALGSKTRLILRDGSVKARAVKLDAGLLIAKLKEDAALQVGTPFGAVSARGGRILVEAGNNAARVRLFEGVASVRRGKGKPVPVLEGRSVEAAAAGVAQRGAGSLTAVPGTPWMIEPPRGFELGKDEYGLPIWKRAWRESLSAGQGNFAVDHVETVVYAVEDIEWAAGQAWPQDCRRANAAANASLFGTVRRETVGGLPAFSYTCAVPGGLKYQDRASGQPVWKVSTGERHRYRDIAVDYNGRSADHVLWARYSHVEAVAEVPGLEGELLDNVRRLVGMTAGADRDGPGADAFFESLETLRPPLRQPEHEREREREAPRPQPSGSVPLLR